MNRANRVLWIVVGVVLTLAGAFGIVAHQGWLPGVSTDRVVFAPDAGATWNSLGVWAPILAIAAGVVLAVLGILLLGAELRVHSRRAMPNLTLRQPAAASPDGEGAGPAGRVRVDTSVLARAMRRDLQADPRISSADVRITGRPDRPEVVLRLEVDQGADLHPVRDKVAHALERLAATMPGRPTISEVSISSGRRAPARVR